jgi:hypothetical protein
MAINLNDKTNKSIAALASKIMQEQPTKMPDFKDTKPIESDMVQRVMNTGMKGNFIKEEAKKFKQIDEALDHEVDNYAKHMLNAHSADDLHIGNEHRDMAHQTLKHIERHYGPVGVRWAEARAGEHIENHNKAQRDAQKASTMRNYKPTPPGAKVYQYPKSEVKENADQINEARFGRAIDPSKLSPEAKARLAARDAAKKPVEAKPGTKLGDIAASFKKPEPKKEEPKEEPKPAAKTGNKFTQLRQQNMERMKQHQAAVASGKVGGGGDQRSGGKLGAPGDVEKKGTEIKGDRGAEHAARTGEKDAGSVVSGTTKAQSERNKRKKGAEDEQDDVHEALKGNQHKIDANRNGKIDAHDFKLLRAKHKKGN